MTSAALAGLLTGLSLIVAIGAQNAFVLRQGLARHYVAMVATVCALSDALLIAVGISGLGSVIHRYPTALTVVKWLGVAYLVYFALHSLWSARRPHVLLPSDAEAGSRRAALLTVLGLTFLNPHVYLDTVLLLGSVGNQYGDDRWVFAAGAMTASVLWFFSLAYGARLLTPLMSRPVAWRILDVAIGVIILLVALNLALTDVAA